MKLSLHHQVLVMHAVQTTMTLHHLLYLFLDCLRAPQKSDLMRKRKVHTNSGKIYKCHKTPKINSFPKSITHADRVKQFKDEPFTVSNGKLFCLACHEDVGLKKSIIDRHIQVSKKHPAAKMKLAQRTSERARYC